MTVLDSVRFRVLDPRNEEIQETQREMEQACSSTDLICTYNVSVFKYQLSLHATGCGSCINTRAPEILNI